MSWMQSAERRATVTLHLLVWKGNRAASTRGRATAFMWPDLWTRACSKMSAPLRAYLSRWSLSSLQAHRTDADVLLRQA